MAGSTVQLRFEYAQDAIATCADVRPGHTCGVSIDNVVVRSLRAIVPAPVNLTLQPQLLRDTNNNIVATVTITNAGQSPANNVRLTSAVLGSAPASSPLPSPVTIPAGSSAAVVLVFPASAGAPGAASVLRINGVYDGGTFGGNLRVTIP